MTRTIVSPFGEINRIQAGVKVGKSSSLRTLLTSADSSIQDLDPESCGPLRKRLARDGR